MNAVKELAYAKINLYLNVTKKRDDGFHEIETVMHTVSLSDEITVSVEPTKNAGQVRLSVGGADFLPTDGRNIAVKASQLFLERCGASANVNIKLKKNIPVAAGLAGGSSDAAAVLRAMNKIFGKPFTEKAILKLAAELGSDVPYCLVGKTALCTGRGEIIERLPNLKNCSFLIIKISDHVSTPAAYSALDSIYGDFKEAHLPGGSLAKLADSLEKGDFACGDMYNIFESAIFPMVPASEKAKKRLLELGADGAMMSGSGPTVFGLFKSDKEARIAYDKLLVEGYNLFFAKSV